MADQATRTQPAPALTLWFVRHAESTANTAEILASQGDWPLSERGLADAGRIASRFLEGRRADALWSSPLSRAVKTAEPFARRLGLGIALHEGLMEQQLGVFSGMTYAEAEADPGYERDRAKRWDWVPPGGESYRMMAARIRPFFATMDGLAPGSRILCFTHAVTLRLIVGLLEDSLPTYPVRLARNGEFLEVAYRGLGRRHELSTLYYGEDGEGRE